MIAKLAKTYILLLLIIGILGLTLTIFLHIRALLGVGFPINHLFVVDFAIAVPLLGLAKERNVWANEIKALPTWVKPLTIGLLYYSIAITLAIIWTPSTISPAESPVVISAFFCAFLSTGICIPIAALTPGYIDSVNLKKRVARSIIGLTVVALFVTVQLAKTLHIH
ncbi:hypothetical protein GCM10011507_06880 [Edaphobacter acidisoli]|uniref:Uncharacterized protein n=2 Tax=Edaphobacter acidisoli TaxID=2040573 RepID=A0A916W0T0_9BACT|nr:hypothetical protein [Edaphobacter acidisoli]GGA58128.1 hypothetical protein GCM10011507_06880 [Edaphobacter acidisoli]